MCEGLLFARMGVHIAMLHFWVGGVKCMVLLNKGGFRWKALCNITWGARFGVKMPIFSVTDTYRMFPF